MDFGFGMHSWSCNIVKCSCQNSSWVDLGPPFPLKEKTTDQGDLTLWKNTPGIWEYSRNAAPVFYISFVFSNTLHFVSQCNTRLRPLYLLNAFILVDSWQIIEEVKNDKLWKWKLQTVDLTCRSSSTSAVSKAFSFLKMIKAKLRRENRRNTAGTRWPQNLFEAQY